MIFEQEFFNLLHLWRDLCEPSRDCFFLDAFDALNRRQRISVGEHRQAFKDRFFAMMLSVKNRPASFGDDLFTGGALPTLTAFASESELPQVACIDSTIIGALFIPTEGIWSG